MANTTLARITKRAKQIQRAHPKMKYIEAQRKAGKEIRMGKKVGAIKKVIKRVKKYSVKKIGKVKVRKRIGTAVNSVKRLEDQLGKEYVKFYNETTVRGTDISRKKIAEIKKQLKNLKK